MSEEEAAELLAQLECDSGEVDELTPEDIAAIRQSDEEYRRGEALDGKALLRELGL